MVSEQQASKELIVRNWSFTYFEGLDRINAALKELDSLCQTPGWMRRGLGGGSLGN